MYDLVPFSRWLQATKKLERKWETDVPGEIKKRGWVRFFNPIVGDYTFCLITNKSGINANQAATVSSSGGNAQAIKFMRDPTRGGLAATLNEISRGAAVSIEIHQGDIAVSPTVQAAADMLSERGVDRDLGDPLLDVPMKVLRGPHSRSQPISSISIDDGRKPLLSGHLFRNLLGQTQHRFVRASEVLIEGRRRGPDLARNVGHAQVTQLRLSQELLGGLEQAPARLQRPAPQLAATMVDDIFFAHARAAGPAALSSI